MNKTIAVFLDGPHAGKMMEIPDLPPEKLRIPVPARYKFPVNPLPELPPEREEVTYYLVLSNMGHPKRYAIIAFYSCRAREGDKAVLDSLREWILLDTADGRWKRNRDLAKKLFGY